MAADDTMT